MSIWKEISFGVDHPDHDDDDDHPEHDDDDDYPDDNDQHDGGDQHDQCCQNQIHNNSTSIIISKLPLACAARQS